MTLVPIPHDVLIAHPARIRMFCDEIHHIHDSKYTNWTMTKESRDWVMSNLGYEPVFYDPDQHETKSSDMILCFRSDEDATIFRLKWL